MTGPPQRAPRIRFAVPSDAPALAGLRYAFRSDLGEPVEEESAFRARCEAWIRPRLAAPEGGTRWLCWVAEGPDGRLVGNVWMQLLEKIPNPVDEPEWHGYVSNFFLLAAERGAGTGSRLLQAAIEEARRRSLDRLVLWPTARSRPLYARHGFAISQNLLELSLR